MAWRFFWNKRPLLDEQTTARDAWMQAQGYTYAGVNGDAGIVVQRSLRGPQPASRIIGPTLVARDPSQTGNPNSTLGTTPLSPDQMAQMRLGSLSNL